ncbi:MAG: ferredoxin [Geminicoccus sp.]|nr:ferredoxin [Geminicoccus sp.]
MSYPIEEIEGIGPSYGAKLKTAGISSTNALLKACAKKSGRKKVADETGISEKLVLEWTNLADLMRIKGIGKQFSELLEAAGVDTVKELRNRNAENTAAKMAEVNAEKKLTRSVPAASMVADWVAQAKAMDPIIEY